MKYRQLIRSSVCFLSTCVFASLLSFPLSAKVSNDELLKPTEVQSETSLDVLRRLQARHYIKKSLSDSLSSRLFDNYLNKLDASRSFFLASDIEEFEKYRVTLDDSLKKGDLEPAFEIFNRYQQRLTDRLEVITANLPAMITAMDFTINESLELDRSDKAWPKNSAELDEVWRKRIKSRVISLRLSDKQESEIAPLIQKRFKNQLSRVQQSNAEDAFQIYINALTELYDPHTSYLSPRTSENFNINMSLSLEGIGAVLQQEDEYTKVVRLVHAGPASKQGDLSPSDRIVAVAQGDGEFQDVIGLRLDEVVDLIRGPKDSIVKLEVIPVSAKTNDEHKIISIKRDKVKLEEQSAQKKIIEILHDGKVKKVGVIDIPAFYIDFDAMRRGDTEYKSTTRDVSRLLSELVDDGVEGIIIDLRDNGGGSLQEANALTGLFIEAGPTVQIRHSDTKVYREGKRRRSDFYDGPLMVVINRLSASASEIFAGAIQDYKRGIIVGSQSFGKGTVQSLSPLEQGQLKVTESKFYRISGDSTQHRGVVPDISFPATYDAEKVGESSLDNALMWDKIDPVRHTFYYDLAAMMPSLIDRHEDRMATDPDFIFLRDQLKLMEEIRQITAISLNEKDRRAQQAEDKSNGLAIENKRRVAKGLEKVASIAEANEEKKSTQQEPIDADKPKAEEPLSSINENDPVLTESSQILMDALPAYNPERVVQAP